MMINVAVEIADDLYFFTKKKYHDKNFNISFEGGRSVKDLVESIGIPHVEIGRVRQDGEFVGVNSLIVEDCCLRIDAPEPGLPANNIPLRFILDVHLGRLAEYLRMLGFDADYSNDRDDAELASLASGCEQGGAAPGGILLSCDRGLLMRRIITAGMLIRSRNPEQQIVEVLRRFNLSGRVRPFSRCFNCGGLLENAGGLDDLSGDEYSRIPDGVRIWCREYTRCTRCGQLYWEGGHFIGMREKVRKMLDASTG
ncbi:MAG: Mut7-C RNAse domain-containing protein [Spirochaetales bacterium]|uniref:Mut7-C RNAse domain-containing protein n=1 Tax=Candidatus Thalassospirochaeta sargassi TaxID=3119039 RepID=A0AAJ1MHX2_9SPIO|nr:Mut7-C RNAse domain-containing protein [Spirochaetales bacterium]